MYIFLRLLLAHFIGDFPLQTNKIYEVKTKSLSGIFYHTSIITLCFILFSWPYLDRPIMWLFIAVNALEHFLQDKIKIDLSKKTTNQLLAYIADQGMHLLTIAIIFLMPIKNFTAPAAHGNMFIHLFNDDIFIIKLIAIIAASYNAHFFIILFKRDFFHIKEPCTSFEKGYGICERACIVAFLFLSKPFIFLIPLIIFLRPILYQFGKKPFHLNKHFYSAQEMLLTSIFSLTFGVGALIFIQLIY
ncbi:DUF3307 domain-containing protein [Candidatus Omnitrophota bacterium]